MDAYLILIAACTLISGASSAVSCRVAISASKREIERGFSKHIAAMHADYERFTRGLKDGAGPGR